VVASSDLLREILSLLQFTDHQFRNDLDLTIGVEFGCALLSVCTVQIPVHAL